LVLLGVFFCFESREKGNAEHLLAEFLPVFRGGGNKKEN